MILSYYSAILCQYISDIMGICYYFVINHDFRSSDENLENINRMLALVLSIVFSVEKETSQSIIENSKANLEKHINIIATDFDLQHDLKKMASTKDLSIFKKISIIIQFVG